jgi:hypothetical protein
VLIDCDAAAISWKLTLISDMAVLSLKFYKPEGDAGRTGWISRRGRW